MVINSATIICFSPTGTTKKILKSIAKGMGLTSTKLINLTYSNVRNTKAEIDGDIVLIGVPVYEERIPKVVYPFLKSLEGHKKPVIIVSVYGNIGEGIVLNELNDIAQSSDFRVVAAGSFIGEHSFSTKEIPVQEGRPNCDDLKKAEHFGKNIIGKLKSIETLEEVHLEIPKGEMPLIAKILPENSARLFTKTPSADMNLCNHCGVCIKLCPMDAIDSDTLQISETLCLRCFCCVRVCPKNARKIIYRPKFLVSQMITSKNKIAKEPKVYL